MFTGKRNTSDMQGEAANEGPSAKKRVPPPALVSVETENRALGNQDNGSEAEASQEIASVAPAVQQNGAQAPQEIVNTAESAQRNGYVDQGAQVYENRAQAAQENGFVAPNAEANFNNNPYSLIEYEAPNFGEDSNPDEHAYRCRAPPARANMNEARVAPVNQNADQNDEAIEIAVQIAQRIVNALIAPQEFEHVAPDGNSNNDSPCAIIEIDELQNYVPRLDEFGECLDPNERPYSCWSPPACADINEYRVAQINGIVAQANGNDVQAAQGIINEVINLQEFEYMANYENDNMLFDFEVSDYEPNPGVYAEYLYQVERPTWYIHPANENDVFADPEIEFLVPDFQAIENEAYAVQFNENEAQATQASGIGIQTVETNGNEAQNAQDRANSAQAAEQNGNEAQAAQAIRNEAYADQEIENAAQAGRN